MRSERGRLRAKVGCFSQKLALIKSWILVMELKVPNKSLVSFDFLPWVWARCPGWRGELVVQDVLLQEMRRECSCSLLSDRITHQLHVSLVFMQHLNYRCDPYKLFSEQPINRWRGWLNEAIGLTRPMLVWHISEINQSILLPRFSRAKLKNHTFHLVEIRIG